MLSAGSARAHIDHARTAQQGVLPRRRLVHGSGSPECTPFPFLHRLLSPIFVGIWTLAVDATKNTLGNTRLPLWVTNAMLGALFPVSCHTLPLADDDVDMYYVS